MNVCCPWCGTEFERTHSRQKNCSVACTSYLTSFNQKSKNNQSWSRSISDRRGRWAGPKGENGLTQTEQEIKENLESQGWTLFRNGWPDFLALKDGKIRLIEVKASPYEKLRPEQEALHSVIAEFFGIDVEVVSPRRAPTRDVMQKIISLWDEVNDPRFRRHGSSH